MESGRKFFTTLHEAVPLPDLTSIQKQSYQWFLDEGLRELFDEVSPMRDFTGRDLELWFTNYYLDEPKFDEVTSKAKNVTFEAPLRATARLVNGRTGEVKEQEIYLGDFPLMTPRGTFVVNGIERVVVSQVIRSAGVFFTSELWRGRWYYGAKIIPNRGAWLEMETDPTGVIWVKIDRKRKVAVTALLRAFGSGTEAELRSVFTEDFCQINLEATLAKDVATTEAEGVIEVYKRIRPGDLATTDNARSLIHSMFFRFDRYDFGRVGRYKLNQRFNLRVANSKEARVMRPED